MHGKKKLRLLTLAALPVIAFVGYRYILSSFPLFACRNKVLSEVTSPDGGYTAAVFEEDCGATSQYMRFVTVRPKSARFDANDKKRRIFGAKDQPTITVMWSGPRHLIVHYSWSERKFLELQKLGDVAIEFSED
jgi:hypothetical protein